MIDEDFLVCIHFFQKTVGVIGSIGVIFNGAELTENSTESN